MNTKQTFEMMEKALPFVLELVKDEAVTNFKLRMKEGGDEVTVAEAMETLMGVYLISKRHAVVGLLSAATGKAVEEIEEQPFAVTRKELEDFLNGEFFAFFTWSLRMATKA